MILKQKIYLKEAGCESVDWILLAQGRVQWGESCQHGNEQPGTLKDDEFLDSLSHNQLLKNDLFS